MTGVRAGNILEYIIIIENQIEVTMQNDLETGII